jgi:hypothetical protein
MREHPRIDEQIDLRQGDTANQQQTGKDQARLNALACSAPPANRARWTIRLLANDAVELKIVDRLISTRLDGRLKKPSQTASEQIRGHSAPIERGLRRRD